jgi:hypothetical protein
LYQAIKKEENLAKRKERNVLKETKNVMSSTPNMLLKPKKNQKTCKDQREKLMFNISPIKLNGTIEDISKVNASETSADSLLVLCLKQKENEEKIYQEKKLNNISEEQSSIEINIIPPDVEVVEPSDASQLKAKRTVHFNQILGDEKEKNISVNENVPLKPGKWKKSLIAWRKSHNFVKRQPTRQFVALFPIKTDPVVIKRFTERLQLSLEKCK